ncbi:MAG TPA: crossover junction endodeoxyribonuclease RuvC [Myxococcales bacterium]|jgi:crossover junction endodeoxyribonuclease RuvC
MRVLGIDPGSRYCGFGMVEEADQSRVKYLAHGVLALGESRPVEERLCDLYDGLCREIEKHRPDVVAVEDVFHAKNARSALVLGQARGVALLAAARSGATIRSFPPSVIKLAVTGSGRAEKEQVGRMVSVLLGVQLEGRLDASDALAAAICGVLRRNAPTEPSRARDWRTALARKVMR